MNPVSNDTRRDRVVVIATHWLGDTFWALQIIPFLQRAFPAAEIHAVVRHDLAWLAARWVGDGRTHGLRGRWSDRRREGWSRPWDIAREALHLRRAIGPVSLAIDLTNSFASAMLVRSLSAARSVGAGRRAILSSAYDVWQPHDRFSSHLALRPWWVIAPLFRDRPDWPSEEIQLKPRLPGLTRASAGEQNEIPIFPGAGWKQKRWPLERFVELGERLASDNCVSLLFSSSEEELCRAALEMTSAQYRDRLRCERPRGAELPLRIARAKTVVTNDSGAGHLAAAMGVPTVALFGPTNPSICGPLGERVRVIRTSCRERPEGLRHHCRERPLDDCGRICLQPIEPATVLDAVQQVLQCSARATR